MKNLLETHFVPIVTDANQYEQWDFRKYHSKNINFILILLVDIHRLASRTLAVLGTHTMLNFHHF